MWTTTTTLHKNEHFILTVKFVSKLLSKWCLSQSVWYASNISSWIRSLYKIMNKHLFVTSFLFSSVNISSAVIQTKLSHDSSPNRTSQNKSRFFPRLKRISLKWLLYSCVIIFPLLYFVFKAFSNSHTRFTKNEF